MDEVTKERPASTRIGIRSPYHAIGAVNAALTRVCNAEVAEALAHAVTRAKIRAIRGLHS